MLADDELGTCRASLVPPEQFVLSIPISLSVGLVTGIAGEAAC